MDEGGAGCVLEEWRVSAGCGGGVGWMVESVKDVEDGWRVWERCWMGGGCGRDVGESVKDVEDVGRCWRWELGV